MFTRMQTVTFAFAGAGHVTVMIAQCLRITLCTREWVIEVRMPNHTCYNIDVSTRPEHVIAPFAGLSDQS
jgi:hypothetical protein